MNTTSSPIPAKQTSATKKLWPHQKKACEMVKKYLTAHAKGEVEGSALVRFPTGAGKTGVIAMTAKLLAPAGLVVVVSPSRAIRDQLVREIGRRFWEKIGLLPPDKDGAKPFRPSTLRTVLDETRARGVLVCTVQTLTALHVDTQKKYGKELQELRRRACLVMFDEGHREPALKWSEAVRYFERPTVLFSATPYRNDYARFNIVRDYVESLRFNDAVETCCIAEVQVENFKVQSPNKYAKSLKARLLKLRKKASDARVILRCGSESSVKEMVEALDKIGLKPMGIHHTFASDSKYNSKVPDPEKCDVDVWVHQHMLIEGIDDPRCKMVAIRGEFGSARAFVQQVGRIIRNPKLSADAKAIVLADSSHEQKHFWDAYLEFERNYDPKEHDIRDLIDGALKAQPKLRYLDGTFRKRFNPSASDFFQHLEYPPTARVLQIESGCDIETIGQALTTEWIGIGRLCLNEARPDPNSAVVLYVHVRNSPVLRDEYYIEDRLGFSVVVKDGDFVFYYDSLGAFPESLDKQLTPVDATRMKRLFGAKTRPTSASLRNSDVGQHALRRRVVSAYSLEEVATGLSDHGYLCTTVEGYADESSSDSGVRRYVGLSRARIREGAKCTNFEAFKRWTASKANALRKTAKHRTFARFATEIKPLEPKAAKPRHILLDVGDVINQCAFVEKTSGTPLEIADLAVKVVDDRFTIKANGKEYESKVSYRGDRGRYEIASKKLEHDFVRSDPSDRHRRNLISYLNREQAFRVVPSKDWTIYAHGQFVQPRVFPDGEDGPWMDLMRLFVDVPALGATTSEKGLRNTARVGGGWDVNCVFGIIERCAVGPQYPREAVRLKTAMRPGFDTVICDDWGINETCDFFCVDEANSRVVVIHAKYVDKRESASVFHDVCSQATKNLDYLQPFSRRRPPNMHLWDKNWTGGNIGKTARLRSGSGKPRDLWAHTRNVLSRPDAKREVWLVLGKCIDIGWLRHERGSNAPAPEALQLFYLLRSTWTAVSSVGATLRVFASDTKKYP